jgi:thiol-disulfide isomerase/thioredoxin
LAAQSKEYKMKNYFNCLSLIFILLITVNTVKGQEKAANSSDLKVKTINTGKLNKIIKNRNGKYLLLNIWATWCDPCREEFPALIKLSEEYKDEIEFIGISVNYPDEADTKIKPFLTSVGVNFLNYVNAEKDVDKFISNLNKDWNGSVPATFIYDNKGNQTKHFIGGKTSDEFEKEISGFIN